MEIFKLKNELDNSQLTNTSLKETITLKENDLRSLHDRLIDVSPFQLSFDFAFSSFSMKTKRAIWKKNFLF